MLDFFTLKGTLLSEIEPTAPDYNSKIAQAVWIDSLTPNQDEKNILQRMLKDLIPDADDVDDIEDSARRFIGQTGIHVHSLFFHWSCCFCRRRIGRRILGQNRHRTDHQ